MFDVLAVVWFFQPDPALADILTLVATIVLPLLVGLVTKASTRDGVKALLLLLLSAVLSVVNAITATGNEGVDLWPVVISTLGIFLVGVGLHYGIWKPTGTSAAAANTLVTD